MLLIDVVCHPVRCCCLACSKLYDIALVLMLSSLIFRGARVLSLPCAFSFASKFCERPTLMVCWGSLPEFSNRCWGSIACRYTESTVAPGAYAYEISGENEWRIPAIGPKPGKNPKNVGAMPRLNWSRFPCSTNSPLVN